MPELPGLPWRVRVFCGIERALCVAFGLGKTEKRLLKECMDLKREAEELLSALEERLREAFECSMRVVSNVMLFGYMVY